MRSVAPNHTSRASLHRYAPMVRQTAMPIRSTKQLARMAEAPSLFLSLIHIYQAEQWDMVARAYNILAIAFLNRGNTPIALDYYLTGLGYCKKYKLANEENVINLNLGTL